jgi:hypothetical protein
LCCLKRTTPFLSDCLFCPFFLPRGSVAG